MECSIGFFRSFLFVVFNQTSQDHNKTAKNWIPPFIWAYSKRPARRLVTPNGDDCGGNRHLKNVLSSGCEMVVTCQDSYVWSKFSWRGETDSWKVHRCVQGVCKRLKLFDVSLNYHHLNDWFSWTKLKQNGSVVNNLSYHTFYLHVFAIPSLKPTLPFWDGCFARAVLASSSVD